MMARAFCPSVAVAVAALLCGPVTAHAQRFARTSVNRSASFNRNIDVNRNTNINRNVNVNSNLDVNRNVNVNRNVDVDVDRGVWGGYGGCCYHSGVGVAAAAAATSAAVTAAVVGTRVYSLPPSCTAVVAGGVTYQQCGSVWYQPQFVGTGTTYVVVNAPY
jgi:hypothetical protein